MRPLFEHGDESTPEHAWLRLPAWERVEDLDLLDAVGEPPARLVVVAAHPDDETLAMAGLLAWASDAGVGTVVVMATGGEHSHPDSTTHTPEDLLALRRPELAGALGVLNPAAGVRWLGLPDGDVAGHLAPLAEALAAVVDAGTLLVSTWHGDGHPDHEAVALVAARVAEATGARHLQAPIWLWHWGSAADVPWASARRLRLGPGTRERKRAAVAAYPSQHEPLSPAAGDEAVLPPAVLAHFDRDFEVYVEQLRTPGPGAGGSVFEALHADSPDPWSLETSWYERRKRDLTLATLPTERLGRVLEVGCSVGVLTERLAARAEHVVAVDVSASALAAAAVRLAGTPHVDLVRMRVPDDWPPGGFSLVVLSEVGYFLTRDECEAVVRRALGCLTPAGSLLLVHWRHPVQGWPLDGDDVHGLAEQLAARAGYHTTTRVDDENFRLDLWRRRGQPSIAALEGKV